MAYNRKPHPNELNVSVDMDTEITRRLRDISSRTLRLATRAALHAAATEIKKVAKQKTPVYTGWLQKALQTKDSKHTSRKLYSLVGASRKIFGPAMKSYFRKKGEAKRAGVPLVVKSKKVRKPTRYLHLVEKGFKHRNGKQVPGHGMLRKSMEQTKEQVKRRVRLKLMERLAKHQPSDDIPTT
jgi:HK97 gp10 family phage protein